MISWRLLESMISWAMCLYRRVKVGLATVCSIVINGVLLKAGIPMDSKFAGILQLKDRKPLRFVELIYYSGSSLDPSETFIMAKMTSVRNVLKQGEGKILANFREIPAPCKTLVEELVLKLNKVRIGGVLSIGEVSEPVCQVHVDLNKVGLILTGGLNPIACAQEAGITDRKSWYGCSDGFSGTA